MKLALFLTTSHGSKTNSTVGATALIHYTVLGSCYGFTHCQCKCPHSKEDKKQLGILMIGLDLADTLEGSLRSSGAHKPHFEN